MYLQFQKVNCLNNEFLFNVAMINLVAKNSEIISRYEEVLRMGIWTSKSDIQNP